MERKANILVLGERKMKSNYRILNELYSFFPMNQQQQRYNTLIEEVLKI